MSDSTTSENGQQDKMLERNYERDGKKRAKEQAVEQ